MCTRAYPVWILHHFHHFGSIRASEANTIWKSTLVTRSSFSRLECNEIISIHVVVYVVSLPTN